MQRSQSERPSPTISRDTWVRLRVRLRVRVGVRVRVRVRVRVGVGRRSPIGATPHPRAKSP